jgi:hypothetical protein
MLIALGALLGAAAAMLALPQALKNVIDKGFTAANAAAIDRYFLLLLVAAAVFAAFAEPAHVSRQLDRRTRGRRPAQRRCTRASSAWIRRSSRSPRPARSCRA